MKMALAAIGTPVGERRRMCQPARRRLPGGAQLVPARQALGARSRGKNTSRLACRGPSAWKQQQDPRPRFEAAPVVDDDDLRSTPRLHASHRLLRPRLRFGVSSFSSPPPTSEHRSRAEEDLLRHSMSTLLAFHVKPHQLLFPRMTSFLPPSPRGFSNACIVRLLDVPRSLVRLGQSSGQRPPRQL